MRQEEQATALAKKEAEARELAFTLEIAIEAARAFVYEWNIKENKVHRRLGTNGPLPPTAPEGDPVEAFLAHVHPDDLLKMQEAIAQSLASPGRRYELNYRVIRQDGSIAWLNEAGQADAAEDGTPVRMIGITRDITELMETQTKLRESQEHLRRSMSELEQLYERAPLGLGLFDSEFRFVRVNQALADMNGFTIAEHLGKTVWDLVPGVRDSAEPALREVLEKGEIKLDVPVVGTTAAQPGVVREWREQFYPFRGDSGEIIGVGVVCEEVTERIRLERDLQTSECHLRSLNETLERRVEEEIGRREEAWAALVQSQKLDALGQLTAGIAHDFNNIVAAMASGFNLIQGWSDDERVREVARLGSDAAHKGAELVKGLLAFARQQVLSPRSVELHAQIKQIAPLIRQSLGHTIKLHINCPKSIGAVHVDPVQLETALINLAINARDAMPVGGDLWISAVRSLPHDPKRPAELGDEPTIAITVRDSGHGMSSDVLNHALDPFFTTKSAGKGTGLGLAMVHGFAKQSLGALGIESEPGKGTSITLYLPCADPPLDYDAPPQESAPAPPSRSERSILVIDDDDLVRAMTSFQLKELGYRVSVASGGDDALKLLEQGEKFDLVLCDFIMPVADGPTVAARIRGKWPSLPIVFMTGHADRERIKGETVLEKPFTAERLAEHIELHFSRSR